MRLSRPLVLAPLLALGLSALPASDGVGEMPYPACLGPVCTDPTDYASYLFLQPGVLPSDFNPGSGDAWKYNPGTGMNVTGAWQLTTGRPDVSVAILDSGIKWGEADLRKKVRLNLGELPPGCAQVPALARYDCNGDGAVTVDDWVNAGVPDANANGKLDGQDMIRRYSNGIDEDGNGYVDDIAGWDFAQNDNDPIDEVEYGHGTGEAHDQVSEANNGGSFPGVSPSSLFVPLKVADSFVAIDSDFARAVVYATDLGVDLISEALGTVSAGPASQEAIDYAYHRGIPIIASAADEESRHHNYPANFEHTIWVNSIRDGDGTFVGKTGDYTLLNGCTNYGGRAWVAIPSASCSSEATGRSAGLTALLVSHGKNLIDRGLLDPYPGLATPFSAEEVRQLYRKSAQDIDQSANLALALPPIGTPAGNTARLIYQALGRPPRFPFASNHFPTQAGWDQFTGWGRPDATVLLDITPANLPPEADLSGSLAWFDVVDPTASPSVAVVGSAAAERERVRTGRGFTYTVEVGCGVQPTTFTAIGSGGSVAKLVRATLATWDPAATAQACGFDPAAVITDPDAHTVQLRLRVTDATGNVGEDRRTVAIHHDPTLRFSKRLGASGEASSALADVDRDGALEIIVGTAAGEVHVLRGSDGSELPGFPARTDYNPAPRTGTSAYATGALVPPREVILAAIAADDLDGDGRIEIVVASAEGKVYVFDDHGRRRPGFPVSTNPAFSNTTGLDRNNDADPGIASAPTLVNLDGRAGDPKLEIVAGGLDGFLYAWRADGKPAPGFPVQLADRSRVDVDPSNGRLLPKPGAAANDRLRKVLSSPAVADLDGDGFPELAIATNEEYGNYTASFATDSNLVTLLQSGAFDIDAFSVDTAGRLYVVHHDGNLHAGGPFRAGWPVEIPLLAPGLLPTVATGTPGSPAIADLKGDGNLAIAIFGAAGPVMVFDRDGQPALGFGSNGLGQDAPIPLAVDFPNGGFPQVPLTAGSGDAPFFPALGSGAFGDLNGDGAPEYVAPTGGVRQLLDVGAPGSQEFGDHSVTAWNPRTGAVLPAFPRKMDDMQFLSSPGIADVDGDGAGEVVQGSGGYLVHAYRADGAEPAGWPKFTHGWMIPAPTVGDVDGDGQLEVVASSREGRLYVWDTPAAATANAVQWQGFGRDRRNTQNLSSGVPTIADGAGDFDALVWALESIDLELRERLAAPGIAAIVRRTTAPVAIRFALYYFTHDDVVTGAGLLRFAEIALRMPPGAAALADLHARLVDAVSDTAHRGVAGIVCAPGDAACAQDAATAQFYVDVGDQFAAAGRDAQAVVWWARSFELIEAR